MEIIHIVLGKANLERMNGVNKVVHQLTSKQTEFGEKVSVWGITDDLLNNYCDRNYETELFLKKNNPFAISKFLKESILSKKNKAIFHFHGGWIPVFYTLSKLLHQNNIPFVYTPHGAYNAVSMQKSSLKKKIYFSLFEKKLLENSTKIHCIGQSEIIGLKKIFKNKKSILLPYGYENNTAISIEKSNNPEIIFGFIGRLDIHTKGLDTLLEAFQNFQKKVPNSKLWIIGDSSEKVILEQQLKDKSFAKNVILFGRKFGEEKNELLKKIDVFVQPSRNEELPLSVIEAASFGKPCIVTDATNISQLITKSQAGKTIYAQSGNLLEKAMFELFSCWKTPNAFIEMQYNAVKVICENYNWKQLISRFNIELYH
ncbi:glycosyltransferase involved in cell wall biosynthesis [Flavobacterium sp. 1]|uniref:glycosyltransferase family 4 protein n=1 Tax=Flavobacterium sp. 1 TaxID=2035200 RepID=UPI000CBE1414|nr:glycosyltransferase [Flavobacterium sp. 1]PJJ08300.1 glycosyltransferase involved in cell wall biosynthesis [Flavobacterium sp. 1]